jgi:hypothetical protein
MISVFRSFGSGSAITVHPDGVAAFNKRWPCSNLLDDRSISFEFDRRGDLIDTDAPDGEAALAMANDVKAFLFDHKWPEWLP